MYAYIYSRIHIYVSLYMYTYIGKSQPILLEFGIPQGSVLGPVLYSL